MRTELSMEQRKERRMPVELVLRFDSMRGLLLEKLLHRLNGPQMSLTPHLQQRLRH